LECKTQRIVFVYILEIVSWCNVHYITVSGLVFMGQRVM